MFNQQELDILEKKEISIDRVNWQLEQFQNGVVPIDLVAPATVNKGINVLDDITTFTEIYDSQEKDIVKFVPASGAASRMFKDLFEFKEVLENGSEYSLKDYPSIETFFGKIKKFAFYNELNMALEPEGGIERLLSAKNYGPIVSKLLLEDGLNYSSLPKGLLSFHFYAGGVARTPFEEHLREGAKYAVSAKKKVKLHFTVSAEHKEGFKDILAKVVGRYEEMYNVKYVVDFSEQKQSTDTLAVTPENKPFYDSKENLLFRPGGHGALIENLDDIDADIVFVKNIDNVVPEKRIASTIKYKKALAGYLLDVQTRVFKVLKKLESEADSIAVEEAEELIGQLFNLSFECSSSEETDNEKAKKLFNRLNRPIRVCGVVKNQGEQGGGPFLTRDKNGCVSPQIVESSQVDLNNETQKNIFASSTHFNPVDLVCGVRDFKGKKFELKNYIDENTCFISHKSKDGKNLKALELPGLWNGAMAYWNTIFIEVPVDTFNPVKTVNDLLRESHQ